MRGGPRRAGGRDADEGPDGVDGPRGGKAMDVDRIEGTAQQGGGDRRLRTAGLAGGGRRHPGGGAHRIAHRVNDRPPSGPRGGGTVGDLPGAPMPACR